MDNRPLGSRLAGHTAGQARLKPQGNVGVGPKDEIPAGDPSSLSMGLTSGNLGPVVTGALPVMTTALPRGAKGTDSESYNPNLERRGRSWNVKQLIECLPTMYEVLGSVPRTI